MDVCRINLSHGEYEDHVRVINSIRQINKELDQHVAILVDLQGPKLRIGDLVEKNIELIAGNEITFTTKECTGTSELLIHELQTIPAGCKNW